MEKEQSPTQSETNKQALHNEKNQTKECAFKMCILTRKTRTVSRPIEKEHSQLLSSINLGECLWMNSPFQTKRLLSIQNTTFIFIHFYNLVNVYIYPISLILEFQRAEWGLRQHFFLCIFAMCRFKTYGRSEFLHHFGSPHVYIRMNSCLWKLTVPKFALQDDPY